MLEGIHVLNKVEKTMTPNWVSTSVIVLVIIGFIVGFVMSILEKDKIYEWFLCGFFISFVGLIVGIIPMFIGSVFCQVPTGEYTYQVTIDNNVNLKEFDNKYHIVKQEGEIYYIEENSSK